MAQSTGNPIGRNRYDRGWMINAECRTLDAEAFHPESGAGTKLPKRVCLGCPVRVECLEYVLTLEGAAPDAHSRFGIAGGYDAKQRTELVARYAPRSA